MIKKAIGVCASSFPFWILSPWSVPRSVVTGPVGVMNEEVCEPQKRCWHLCGPFLGKGWESNRFSLFKCENRHCSTLDRGPSTSPGIPSASGTVIFFTEINANSNRMCVSLHELWEGVFLTHEVCFLLLFTVELGERDGRAGWGEWKTQDSLLRLLVTLCSTAYCPFLGSCVR